MSFGINPDPISVGAGVIVELADKEYRAFNTVLCLGKNTTNKIIAKHKVTNKNIFVLRFIYYNKK